MADFQPSRRQRVGRTIFGRTPWPTFSARYHDAEDAAQATTVKGNSQYVLRESVQWLSAYATALWPGFVREDGELAWDLLVDPEAALGAARMDAQYHRANTHGTERYVPTRRARRSIASRPTNPVLKIWCLPGTGPIPASAAAAWRPPPCQDCRPRVLSPGYPRTVIGESR
ncbi:MAG: hypothetical protein IPP90_10605 [Gemmatimonadaceae bacterium]|nr:hypothetical protein [Gemmatimonadaceae bacterium]